MQSEVFANPSSHGVGDEWVAGLWGQQKAKLAQEGGAV